MRWLLPLVLLAAGFLAFIFALALLAEGESARRTQLALVIYARTLLLKGLLPQGLLALALLAALERRRAPALPLAGWRAALAVAACAAVAGLVVAAVLLPLDLPGLPAARYTDAWNFTATLLEMTAGVAAAMGVSRWLLGWRSRRPEGRGREA